MAEGGRLGQSVKGSDAIHDYNCSECLRRKHTYTEAIFYCPDCHINLCPHCVKCGHDVIGRRNVDKWGKPSTNAQFDPCQKHKDNLVQRYCPKDDVVCCDVCSQSDHMTCDDSVYIPLVANSKQNKTARKKINKGLGELHKKSDNASKDRATKLTGLDQIEQRLVTGVKEFRARVDALLNSMEKQSLADIAKFITNCKDQYKSELNVYDTIKTEIKDLQSKLDTASTDESLRFSRIKQVKVQLHDKTSLFLDTESTEISDKAQFEPYTKIETILKSLSGLGKILTDTSEGSYQIPESGMVIQSDSQLQGMGLQPLAPNKPYRTLNTTSFNLKSKQDKKKSVIYGMCMMSSGHLIVADATNHNLKKLNSQYELIKSYSLKDCWATAICPTEADQVAVAFEDQTMQLLTVAESMPCTSSFSTKHDCESLAYSNKCLYITSQFGTGVYVYDLVGTRLRVITKDQHGKQLFSNTRYIASSRDGARLHVTDGTDMVTMDTSGNLISRFFSGELKGGPWAVCADGEGRVFVGGHLSNNVLQLDGEADKKLAEILSHSDRLNVRGLCFDRDHCRLMVFSKHSDSVLVLHLTK